MYGSSFVAIFFSKGTPSRFSAASQAEVEGSDPVADSSRTFRSVRWFGIAAEAAEAAMRKMATTIIARGVSLFTVVPP